MIRPILAAGLLKLHEVKPEGAAAAGMMGGWEDGWSKKSWIYHVRTRIYQDLGMIF